MSSLPLFDKVFSGPAHPTGTPLTGRDLAQSGIEEAYQRALRVKAGYVEKCLAAIRSFPSGTLFTSEDLRDKAGDPPCELDRSVLAGIMRAASGKEHKLIKVTGHTQPAKRVSVHAKDLHLWQRL